MSYPKVARLILLLIEQTNDGRLSWEPTDRKDVFQANFPRYSVRILTVPAEFESDVMLQIINDEGFIVESISDPQVNSHLEGAYTKMLALHESARRSAMGVEQALDDIIGWLEPDIPF